MTFFHFFVIFGKINTVRTFFACLIDFSTSL